MACERDNNCSEEECFIAIAQFIDDLGGNLI